MDIIDHNSPNHNARSGKVQMLILHYTDMASTEAALARLCSPKTKLSAHYLISPEGKTFSLVPESRRAWHAGESRWQDMRDINDCSLGIELVHDGHKNPHPYPKVQLNALIELAGMLIKKYHILPRHVLAHSDIAPDRKEDPGEFFDWGYLAQHHIGIAPPRIMGARGVVLSLGEKGGEVLRYQENLARFGYGVHGDGRFGGQTRDATIAFGRHFYPHQEALAGKATPTLQAMLTNIIATHT